MFFQILDMPLHRGDTFAQASFAQRRTFDCNVDAYFEIWDWYLTKALKAMKLGHETEDLRSLIPCKKITKGVLDGFEEFENCCR